MTFYCWQESFKLWMVQQTTRVLHVLHIEIQSILSLSVTVTSLFLSRNFSDLKQELGMSRNITGSLLGRKSWIDKSSS